MTKGWIKVFSSGDSFKISLAKALLENNEINVVVISKQDSMNLYLNTGFNIELFVKEEEAVKATHILKKDNL